MKTKNLISLFVLLSCPAILFSQSTSIAASQLPAKNQLGIQVNPVYNHSAAAFKDFVFSIRYGYKVTRPITIGAEISSSSPNRFSNSLKDRFQFNEYNTKIGLFARYTFLAERRIQPFIEISPYFMDTAIENNPLYHDLSYWPDNWEYWHRGIKLYVAPGVSLFSKNRKFSLDLLFKLPIPTTGYDEKPDFSYKFNFHF